MNRFNTLALSLAITLLASCSESNSPQTPSAQPNAPDTSGQADANEAEAADEGSEENNADASNGNSDTDTDTDTQCTTTDVGIAFQAINATVISDPDNAPSALIDGCVDRASGWSGDKGSIVTLDAGAVHQMQGVYLWSTFGRMEWIRIESSTDGLQWVTDWQAMPTKPVNGPVYYPLTEAGPKRYIRITGFGSEQNTWSNISEARWSLSGYQVQGQKMLELKKHTSFGDSTEDFEDLASFLMDNSSVPYTQCDVEVGVRLNATGHLDTFHQMLIINGVDQHMIDFEHYPVGVMPNSSYSSYPETYAMLNAANASAFAQTTSDESSCLTSGLRDSLWYFDELVDEARQK